MDNNRFELADPFSIVYNALWRLVERNEALLKLVPPRNRIKFDNTNPIKNEIGPADRPELALLSADADFPGAINSDQVSVKKQYIWMISTGEFLLTPIFNRVTWELFRSLHDWECILCDLEWCGCRFVKNFRMLSSRDGTEMRDKNKNLPGWSAIWVCEVDLVFNIRQIRIQ